MKLPSAVVAGASGIVGCSVGRYLAQVLDWSVVGLSRKPTRLAGKFGSIGVDLTKIQDCREKLAGLRPTHLIYAARFDHSATPSEPIDTNLAMLANLMDVIEPQSIDLCHVHLVHGTKYYGAPYGRYKTPSREDDPRHLIDTFYYAQQDFIEERQRGRSWTWSISRPQAVSDYQQHVTRSVPWGIAVYATICKAKGLPLSFPSSEAAFRALYQCTDAQHLAKAIAWMCTDLRCANQAFNVTNGDYFRWENLWPRIAEYFGISVGEVHPVSLTKVMSNHAEVWASLSMKHGLANPNFENLVLWSYLDFALAPGYDRMSDLNKLRKFGFLDCIDSEDMFVRFFDSYRRQRMIPD